MKIKNLNLYTDTLGLEQEFYSGILGFEITEQQENFFTIKVGWSELSFHSSEIAYNYHYCFLIPSNKLVEAFEWMDERVNIIDIENDRKIQKFDTWNAESFYFNDASGNLVEFIVRYDLKNESDVPFEISSVLCINEIGMPTQNIEKINSKLEKNLQTRFWKGDLTRFGTNGSQEGLFLLPNYELKDQWFPTELKVEPSPFEAMVENEGKSYIVKYGDGGVNIISNE